MHMRRKQNTGAQRFGQDQDVTFPRRRLLTNLTRRHVGHHRKTNGKAFAFNRVSPHQSTTHFRKLMQRSCKRFKQVSFLLHRVSVWDLDDGQCVVRLKPLGMQVAGRMQGRNSASQYGFIDGRREIVDRPSSMIIWRLWDQGDIFNLREPCLCWNRRLLVETSKDAC